MWIFCVYAKERLKMVWIIATASTLKSTSQIFLSITHWANSKTLLPTAFMLWLSSRAAALFMHQPIHAWIHPSLLQKPMNAASMQPKQIPLSLNIHGRKELGEKYGKTAGPLELNENSRRGGKREKKLDVHIQDRRSFHKSNHEVRT